MNTHIIMLSLVIGSVFTTNSIASETIPPTPEPVVSRIEAAPENKTGFPFSWLFVCVVTAGSAYLVGKTGGSRDNDFTACLLDGLVSNLSNVPVIEYEIVKMTSGRVKLIFRILTMWQDGTGKLTTTEKEMAWEDLPDDIRADFTRNRKDKHIRSLKRIETTGIQS